ncbi:MAG: efflux RND transporter periplasmic adaptor subunit [Hyphomicrobiales bacterium]|nr:efflux RND transporter periplasmic adaptor subunit [Hyphomicrobiales bacterium]
MFLLSSRKASDLSRRGFALSLVVIAIGGARATNAAMIEPNDELRALAPETGPEIRAQLTPRQYTTLSSEMAGRIDRISTKLGEHFKKGDNLIAFDCVLQHAQVARAQAVSVQAEKTYGINQRLLALKSIGQLELDVSAAEVQKSKADLAGANAVASKCAIDAPFNGVTVEQKAREFQYASPGQPLLDILDDRSLEVELIAPSRWLNWLQPGYAFALHIDETGKNYAAKITRIGGRVDPVSQSIKVVGEITDAAPELIAGMSGRAIIDPPR